MPFIPADTATLTLSDREKALERRMSGDPLPAPALASLEISRVILKACAFDPRDRFKTASEMKKALEECKYPVPIPEPKPVPKPVPPEPKPLPKTVPLPIKRDLGETVSASGKITDHSQGDWRGDSTSEDAKHARDVKRVPSSAAKKTLMASMVLAVLAIFAFLVLPNINGSSPNTSDGSPPTPTARSANALIPTAAPTPSPTSGSGNDVITIGVFEPLTGDNAAAGELEVAGIELANELYPEVLGKKVVLVKVDNKSDKAEAATAAARLVEQNKVQAIIGSWGSSLSMAAGNIVQDAKIPAVGASCTNPQVTLNNDYYFRVCFIDPFQGTVMANYATTKLGAKTAAIIQEVSNDYSVGLASFFEASFTQSTGDASSIV
jgi:hypothetical protein